MRLVAVAVLLVLGPAGRVAARPTDAEDDADDAYGWFDCHTPGGGAGHCVLLSECRSFAPWLQRPNRLTASYIRNSTCGMVGSRHPTSGMDRPTSWFSWVCCPPKTPNLSADGPSHDESNSLSPQVSHEVYDGVSHDEAHFKCGQTDVVRDRIVGGQISPKGAWPWMAMTIHEDKKTGKPKKWCGAALIGRRHVLTAAHCFHNFKPNKPRVRLGEHEYKGEVIGDAVQDIAIKKVLIHEDYNEVTLHNDIALLVLEKPAVFTERVHPVCLPTVRSTTKLEGQLAFVAGWGSTKENGNGSSVLMEAMVPLLAESKCRETYAQVGLPNTRIEASQICAGYADGGIDSCQGDSGGPLMGHMEGDSRFQLLGLVSWGIGCARPEYPGVYTRVVHFVDWVQAKMASTR